MARRQIFIRAWQPAHEEPLPSDPKKTLGRLYIAPPPDLGAPFKVLDARRLRTRNGWPVSAVAGKDEKLPVVNSVIPASQIGFCEIFGRRHLVQKLHLFCDLQDTGQRPA